LFAALNGYLETVPSDMINVYESLFKKWFSNSIYYHPISRSLSSMVFPKELVSFITWEFANNFSLYYKNNYIS
jgi:hypothetical protein